MSGNNLGADDHKLVSALGMAVSYTQRSSNSFARRVIRVERAPNTSQTVPNDVTGEVEDAARLELACVKTWVGEEDTRESTQLFERFPLNGATVTERDVHEEEVGVRTVTVRSDNEEHDFEELKAGEIRPVAEAGSPPTYWQEKLENTLRPEGLLREEMSLEEATKWLSTFDNYLSWNVSIIGRKSTKCVRGLLESLLGTCMILSTNNFVWTRKAIGLNDPKFEVICAAKLQSPRSTPLMNIPPQPMFNDKTPETVGIDDEFHKEQDNITVDIHWDPNVKTKDFNANTRDLDMEGQAYGYQRYPQIVQKNNAGSQA